MRWMLAILTATMFLPGALANDDAWTLHAQSDISASSERGLTEVYVPRALQESPAQQAVEVHWTWWAWSDETGSSTMMHCIARQPKTSRSMHLQRTQPWNGIHGRLRPTSRCRAR